MTTLPSLILPVGEWVSIYPATGIPYGTRIIVHNIGASAVRLATSLTQPAKDTDAYQIIQANDLQMINEPNSPGEWAYSPNQPARINVRPA